LNIRIAFVRPRAPFNPFIQNVPLNYIHLAAYLRQYGYEPVILDAVLKRITPQYIDRVIAERGITVVGIGCMTCELPQALEQAARLKQVHPGLRIVFGGAHPSGDPEECLRSGVVDYVIVGEGEMPLLQLLNALREGRESAPIRGVWKMHDGCVVPGGSAEAPDVGKLPRPAYEMLNLEQYYRLDSPWHFLRSRRALQFITQRGCPYQCSYCHEIHTKKFRGIPAEVVLDQMEWLVREHRVREFMIVDDIFNFDLGRAKAICRGIVLRGLDIYLQFPNGVRGDCFDEELVALMKQAGTHYMAIAIETVSHKFQKLVRKNLKIDKARQTIEWARKYGIEVCGFFMIGFPGETRDEVQATLDYALEAPLDLLLISIVAPFKGTRLRTDMVAGSFGEMSGESLQALDQLFPVVHNPALPTELLLRLQRQAYWRFYAKPRSLIGLGSKITSFRNVRKLGHALARRIWEERTGSVN
jgi:anaerobic magnesium-protoporphyrin IX monomethyl ester cyclase